MTDANNINYHHREASPEEIDSLPEEENNRLPGIFSLPPDKKLIHGPLQIFLSMLVVSIIYWSYPQGKYLAASGKSVFQNREYWRLVTALFTHGDLAHLLANGWIFILFGWMLRTYFGLWAFPAASFGAGILTNVITVSVYPPETMLIGASGMVHSMVALWITWYIFFDRERSPGQRLLRGTGFSLAMLVPAVVKPGISYLAHGVGFLIGIGFSLLFFLPVKRRTAGIEQKIKEDLDSYEEDRL